MYSNTQIYFIASYRYEIPANRIMNCLNIQQNQIECIKVHNRFEENQFIDDLQQEVDEYAALHYLYGIKTKMC